MTRKTYSLKANTPATTAAERSPTRTSVGSDPSTQSVYSKKMNCSSSNAEAATPKVIHFNRWYDNALNSAGIVSWRATNADRGMTPKGELSQRESGTVDHSFQA